MRIDWNKGAWRVWCIESGALLGSFATVRLENVVGELINTDGGRHGWLIVAGRLIVRDGVGVIIPGTSVQK